MDTLFNENKYNIDRCWLIMVGFYLFFDDIADKEGDNCFSPNDFYTSITGYFRLLKEDEMYKCAEQFLKCCCSKEEIKDGV